MLSDPHEDLHVRETRYVGSGESAVRAVKLGLANADTRLQWCDSVLGTHFKYGNSYACQRLNIA